MDTTAAQPAPAAPTATGFLADAKMLGRQALGAIKTAIDSTFGKTEATVPQLTGDVAKFTDGWITTNVHGAAATYLKTVLGLAETTGESTLDTAIVAGLVEANHIADARLDAFHPAN